MATRKALKKIGLDMSCDLNVPSDDAFFTWSGRLFHAMGPATEKEQSPRCSLRITIAYRKREGLL